MGQGIAEALRPLRPDAQRQVVLVTDGLIGFEGEIVAAVARDLPPGSRLHTVGVGSAVNRGLTAPAARAGRGAEVVIGLDEEPAEAARQLVARTRAPLLTDLALEGSALVGHAPARLPDLLAGGPALVGVTLRPEGGRLRVRGRTPAGVWDAEVDVPALDPAKGSAAVVTLYGREAVEDLELRAACGEAAVDAEIERLGLAFQIATRLTSWVAVSEEPAVDPTQPSRRERMPHALPAGLSVEGLGLRGATAMVVCQPASYAPDVSPPSARVEARLPQRLRSGKTVKEGPPDLDLASALRAELFAGLATGLPTHLAGRIVRREDRELVIEIALDRPIDWDPRGAEVVWGDGTRLAATIDARLTTRKRPVRRWPADPAGPSPRWRRPAPGAGRGAGAVRRVRAADGDARGAMTDLDVHLPAIAAGDEEAFAAWLAGGERRVRLSLRSFAAHVDTEALLQETLLRVWQVAPRVKPDGRPDALLRLAIRTGRNLAVSELRRARLQPVEIDELERAAAALEGGPPPDRAGDPFLRQAIVDCHGRLPARPARALDARLGSAGSERDALLAERVGMRLNTFLQNITRARRLLEECLRRRGIDLAMELV